MFYVDPVYTGKNEMNIPVLIQRFLTLMTGISREVWVISSNWNLGHLAPGLIHSCEEYLRSL